MTLRREPDRFTPADYPVLAQRVAVTGPVAPHIHDFCELAVVSSGTVEHRTAAGVHRLGRGRVVAVRPGSWHGYDRPRSCVVINIYLEPRLLLTDLSWSLDRPALARLLLHGGVSVEALAPDRLAEVAGWLDQLAEPVAAGPEQAILRRSLLGCVLARLSVLTIEAAGSAMITTPVRVALTAVSADLARPWTVTELAAEATVSASVLHRLFRTELGVTPLGWLTRTRAERFAVRLLGSDDPVAAIGREVGWADPNYASRRFRQVYGVTPTDYRRRLELDPVSGGPAWRPLR